MVKCTRSMAHYRILQISGRLCTIYVCWCGEHNFVHGSSMLLAPRKCRAFSTCAASTWIRPDSFDYLQQTIESRAYEAAVQTPLTYASGLSKQLASKCSLFLKREVPQVFNPGTAIKFSKIGSTNHVFIQCAWRT